MSNYIRAINEDFGEDTESVNEKELLSDGELLDKIYDWMVRETGNHTLEHKGRKLLAREILGFLKDNEEEKSNE
jgi:hypothetical protein